MNPETLAALKASIEHHEANRNNPETATTSSNACALCRLFIQSFCVGCPVSEAADKSCCDNTPYEDVFWSLKEFRKNPTEFNRKNFTEAEQREIDFLHSLLPVEKTAMQVLNDTEAEK